MNRFCESVREGFAFVLNGKLSGIQTNPLFECALIGHIVSYSVVELSADSSLLGAARENQLDLAEYFLNSLGSLNDDMDDETDDDEFPQQLVLTRQDAGVFKRDIDIALDAAREAGHAEMCRLLVSYGAR